MRPIKRAGSRSKMRSRSSSASRGCRSNTVGAAVVARRTASSSLTVGISSSKFVGGDKRRRWPISPPFARRFGARVAKRWASSCRCRDGPRGRRRRMDEFRKHYEGALDRTTDTGAIEEAGKLLLRAVYPDIEPIGGRHDYGRDAAVYRAAPRSRIVIAISAQADWRAKVRE